jgi:hypothetical protein
VTARPPVDAGACQLTGASVAEVNVPSVNAWGADGGVTNVTCLDLGDCGPVTDEPITSVTVATLNATEEPNANPNWVYDNVKLIVDAKSTPVNKLDANC